MVCALTQIMRHLDLLWTSNEQHLQGGPILYKIVLWISLNVSWPLGALFAMAPVSTNRCPSTDGAKIQTLRLLMLQQICQDILEKQSEMTIFQVPTICGPKVAPRTTVFTPNSRTWLSSTCNLFKLFYICRGWQQRVTKKCQALQRIVVEKSPFASTPSGKK